MQKFLGQRVDMMQAIWRRYGALRAAERATRRHLLAVQARHLGRLLAHAAQHSPFYRQRWGGSIPRPADLPQLEPLTRAELAQHLDQVLTDRSLNRDMLYGWLGQLGRHPYVVVATSGTTGEPIIVPYTRQEWITGLAYALRGAARRTPNPVDALLDSRRFATVATQNPIHVTTQMEASFAVLPGAHLHLAASMALDEQVAKLQRFQPTLLRGYSWAIDLLAKAQLAGELSIAPRKVTLGGETLPPGLRERVRAAWSVEPFDCYGLTETLLIGWECLAHCGMHLDEDAVVLEVVDEHNRVLPPGEEGAAILVTNLYNYTMPLIRHRIDDLIRIDDTPCPCGVPFARIVAIEGRRDEMLYIRDIDGMTVPVHPTVLETPLEALAAIRRFQIRNHEGACQVLVVPHEGAEELATTIREALVAVLAPYAVPPDTLSVAIVAEIDAERGRTDKRRRVVRLYSVRGT